MAKPWYVYIIESSDNRLYTGITTDMDRRWKEHLGTESNKVFKGAKFFRGRKPSNLMYLSQVENRSLASKRESAIKKLSRVKKIQLIESKDNSLDEFSDNLAIGCLD